MATVEFKENTSDIKALRAIKPLALEIKEREELGFAAALNKASIELGFKNYSAYKIDSLKDI